MSDKSISITSSEALPLELEGLKSSAFKLHRRFWKLGIAGGVLFAGAFGILSENKYVSTNDAVVSTYVLSVRTPVEGTVTGLPIAAGVNVQTGELLGQLDNPLSDHQHLDNLLTLKDAADSTAGAIINEQGVLNEQRSSLVTRAEEHATAVSERLNHQIIEAEHLLSVRQLALDQANTEASRARQLRDLGVVASADFEKLLSTQRIAAQELAGQQAELESVRSQALAASHGVLTEPGTSSDVSYSQQRADEISI
jgi:multidrug resistance efflux pump